MRRILARSRSAGYATRDSSQRRAYERSYSCPEYPVHTNTYKITDNKKDYIFDMNLAQCQILNVQNVSTFDRSHRNPQPFNLYYGSQKTYSKEGNIQVKSQPLLWQYKRAMTIETDCCHPQPTKIKNKRRLPKMCSLQYPCERSLPNIPAVNLSFDDNFKNHLTFSSKSRNSVEVINKETECSQYPGYDSDGSEAETTIHISVDKQNSLETSPRIINKNQSTSDSKIDTSFIGPNHVTKCMNRKNLSLDLKTRYDKSPNKTQSLGFSCPVINCEEIKSSTTKTLIDHHDIQHMRKNTNIKRRHSDSVVFSKCFPAPISDTVTPEEVINHFKKMSIGSVKSTIDASQQECLHNILKKSGNTVSINETPTFQEYHSPSSISPPPSIDMSFTKPLPSIIKKARNRSRSLSSTVHLDRKFSNVANSMYVALSPPNLGSPKRALSPVASLLPDDIPRNDAPLPPPPPSESSTSLQTTPNVEHQTTRQSQRNVKPQKPPPKTATKKPRGKSASHRESKRSNDYCGRENGRGNNQPQPLERRESRRGQFTRSLSNADVPPDEKAGKYNILNNTYSIY